MNLEDTIVQYIHSLPDTDKAELLDFIEYLKIKRAKEERSAWADFSVSSAMRGMEHEDTPYSVDDLKESFS
jgi:formylmethanofuran dehydrogenase subunit B